MAERPDELALVERFRRGDDAAFDRIVAEHGAGIAALANRLLAWPHDVDDVVQEVFIAAFQSLPKFRGQCRLRTWLFTITVNRCRHYRRRYLRHARWTKGKENAPSLCLSEDAQIVAIDAERFSQVRKAVRALPARYREVAVLRYLQGLETTEICRLLAITGNALNVRLTRAREKLRADLSELIEEQV